MRKLLLFALFLTTFAPTRAQLSQPDWKAQLVDKPLLLRGLWQKNKLHFNSAGQLLDPSRLTSPMFAGIDITKAEQKTNRLLLTGRRFALRYSNVQMERVDAGEKVSIEIAGPPSGGDYDSALHAIFASDLAELAPAAPDYWQFVLLHGPDDRLARPQARTAADPGLPIRKIGGGVSAPRVLSAPEPEFSQFARSRKINGTVLVYLQVDTHGNPMHVSLRRPLGYGLDEQAVAAVEHYRFAPAEDHGTPVPVEMNVEVNFQIF